MADQTTTPAARVSLPDGTTRVQSQPSSALTIRRVEIPQQIKAAISERMAAELSKR